MAREIKNMNTRPSEINSGGFSLPAQVSRRRAGFGAWNTPSCLRGCSISQILNAFPAEARELVPRQIIRLNRIILPYKKWIDQLYTQKYSDFTKWFIVRASRLFDAPIAEIRQLDKLKKMSRFMKGGTDNMPVSHIDIEKARNVPISSLIECKRLRGRWWARCPFHEDKTPSLIINNNNTFKCFSCQAYGDSIDFIMRTEGLKFIEAVKFLIDKS